ncbi:hypothetical protein VP01_3502g6, partial [Puccinia sorghi]
LPVFNYGSFSQITIPTSKPPSHCSNSLTESQPRYGEASKIGTTGIAAKGSKDLEGYLHLQTHVPKQNTFIVKQFYSISYPLFDEVKQQHNALNEPGLEQNFKEDPNFLKCHLSFTTSNVSNLTHKEDDASPFIFVIWIPIKQKTCKLVEDKFEVHGGEFIFPDDPCGIILWG